MRIAVVAEQADASRGGAETSTLELVSALHSLGADVTLVTGERAAPEKSDPESNAAQACAPHRRTIALRGSKAAAASAFLRDAAEHCRSAGYDAVHAIAPVPGCHVYQPRGGTYRETIRRSAALPAPPLVRVIRRLGRHFNLRQQALRRAEDLLLDDPNPPFVACLSEYVRRQVLRDRPAYPAERLHVIAGGVALEPLDAEIAARRRIRLRQEWRIDGDARILLFVAHNFKLKGLDTLLRALAAMPEALLVVAGRDDPRRWERRAQGLGCAGRVRFIGAGVPVAELLVAADVLAHPTYYDPCSRVVLEALRCGLPAVTTCWNGAGEWIRPDGAGAVIDDPSDAGELAKALRRALQPSQKELARAAAAELGERLSMRRHARELLELYALVREREATGGTPAERRP